MGVSIVPLAVNHKLDMCSEKALATDTIRLFAGSVTMFEESYNKEEGWNLTEKFKIPHPQENGVQIWLTKKYPCEGEGQSYEIDVEKDRKEVLESMFTSIMSIYIVWMRHSNEVASSVLLPMVILMPVHG